MVQVTNKPLIIVEMIDQIDVVSNHAKEQKWPEGVLKDAILAVFQLYGESKHKSYNKLPCRQKECVRGTKRMQSAYVCENRTKGPLAILTWLCKCGVRNDVCYDVCVNCQTYRESFVS